MLGGIPEPILNLLGQRTLEEGRYPDVNTGLLVCTGLATINWAGTSGNFALVTAPFSGPGGRGRPLD